MNEREVAAWLCQQFSRGMLVFVFEENLIHILDLCVRHDVAVLTLAQPFCCLAKLVVE